MKALLVAILALTSTSAFAYRAQKMELSEDKTALEITVSFSGCSEKKFELQVGCGRSLPAQCALGLTVPGENPLGMTCMAYITQKLSFPLANYGLDTYSASEAVLSLDDLKLTLPNFN